MTTETASRRTVAVVIPAFCRTARLRRAILSVFAQEFNPEAFELIVVDSSPDDRNQRMFEEIRNQAPCRVRFFHKRPEGPGPSRSRGVRESDSEFVAFLDSDCEATPQWLRHGLAAFAAGVGLVQGRVLPVPGESLGVFKHYVRIERESPWYEAANLFYRREALEEAGEFMADWTPGVYFCVGGEDTDLAWRVKTCGWESRYEAQALVYHEVAPLPPGRWVYHKRLIVFPWLARKHPELRRHFYLRYFYSKPQALYTLALVGLVSAAAHPWSLALALPYIYLRLREPSASLRGPLRLLRPAVYGVQDTISFLTLLIGSARSGALLL